MNIHGYCTQCHKIKRVRVSGHGLAMMGTRGGAAQGICAACAEASKPQAKTARQR